MRQELQPQAKLRDDLEVDKTIKVYVTAEQHERWKKAADADRRSLSSWIAKVADAAAVPPPAIKSKRSR